MPPVASATPAGGKLTILHVSRLRKRDGQLWIAQTELDKFDCYYDAVEGDLIAVQNPKNATEVILYDLASYRLGEFWLLPIKLPYYIEGNQVVVNIEV